MTDNNDKQTLEKTLQDVVTDCTQELGKQLLNSAKYGWYPKYGHNATLRLQLDVTISLLVGTALGMCRMQTEAQQRQLLNSIHQEIQALAEDYWAGNLEMNTIKPDRLH